MSVGTAEIYSSLLIFKMTACRLNTFGDDTLIVAGRHLLFRASLGKYGHIYMKYKTFTNLYLCKTYWLRLTFGLMNTGLEVSADIQAYGVGLEIWADDA